MNYRYWLTLLLVLTVLGCSNAKEETRETAEQQTAAQAVESSEVDESSTAEAEGRDSAEKTEQTAQNHAEKARHASHDKHEKQHGKHDEHSADGPRGHRFDHPEKYAERWNDPARDAWQKPDEVMSILGVQKDMTVVDLGTGTGYFVPHLAEAVGSSGEVLALDVEESMVEYVKRRVVDLELDEAEARLVPYDDPELEKASVDRILTVNTWHHIQDRDAYAKKLHDALRPEGAVAVVDYTLDSPQGPPKDHKLEPEKVVEELEAGGFDAKIVEENLPRQYIVIGQKPAQ